MKGNPMMVTSVSFQDMPHMKMKKPTPLRTFSRKTLTFWEMRSLTWVVSADRRERIRAWNYIRTDHTKGGTCAQELAFNITCVIVIKKGNFLPHQGSEKMVPETKV